MNEITEYWDRQPCNVGHGTAPVGSLEWSQQVTQRKYFVEPHIPQFAWFPHWRGKEVLEIGCGIGTDTIEFAAAGARVFAVDISESSAMLARGRVSLTPFGESVCIGSYNAEDHLPSWTFDLIYSFGVLHHTPHPKKVLQLARKRIAPTGELRIMLYAKYSLKHFLGTQPEAQAGCPLVKWYSGIEVRRLLDSCGFRVVSIQKTHIFPWRVKDYVEHRYVKAWPWRWMPQWMFHGLERLMGHHLLIVAVPR